HRKSFCEGRRISMHVEAELGDHAAATAAAAALARSAADPSNDTQQAAALFASCVPLAEKDSKLGEPARQKLMQAYADKSLDLLRQAIRKGFKDAVKLEKDSAWASVRSRLEF